MSFKDYVEDVPDTPYTFKSIDKTMVHLEFVGRESRTYPAFLTKSPLREFVTR